MAAPGTRRTMADWEHEVKRPGGKLTVEEANLLLQLAILERVEILKLMGDALVGQVRARAGAGGQPRQASPPAPEQPAAHEPEPAAVNGQEAAV